MSPDAWVRAAHPWCGWLRFALLPLMFVPMWFGQLAGAVVVILVWMLLPRLFSKPTSDEAWMTRAQYGVQIWRSRPFETPRPLLMLCLVVLSLMRGADTASDHRPMALALYAAAYIVTHLVFLTRTAALYASRRAGPSDSVQADD